VKNQIWEREIDGRMARTSRRPLPTGRIGMPAAVAYCSLLGGAGTLYLWQTAGIVPAAWGVATWLTYVVIYTPLKTRTSFNTTVGAVSGALRMMIGYTAGGGGSGDLIGWLLVAVLMVWQYPHFMAIAWMYRREYGEAGFRMTPVVEPTGRSAAWQAVLGSVALLAVLIGLTLLLVSGPLRWGFAAAMVLTTFGLLTASLRFARDRDTPSARRMMRASLLQLPAAMLVLVVASIF
jgi:protoheme IX farnesyltransferase